MNKLQELLQEKFPDTQIVKLKDYTTKIAGISKVRYGDNCTDRNYCEISLNNVDEYGVIYIPDDYKEPAPANSTALINQTLYENDLIILHRGKIGKMGIIGSNYSKRVVGNNSMIRLQFTHDRKKDTPWFVMQYLQLPYVQEYIHTYIPSSGSASRKILNPEVLSNLPIPLFKECGGRYRKTLLNKKALRIKAKSLSEKFDSLSTLYSQAEDESVSMGVSHVSELESAFNDDRLELDELCKIESLFDKYTDM